MENPNESRIPTFWQICLGVMVAMGIVILLAPAFSDQLKEWLQDGPGGLESQGTALVFIGSAIFAIVTIANNRSLNPINYVPQLSAAVFLALGALFVLTEENPLLTGVIILVFGISVVAIAITLLIVFVIRRTPGLIRKTPGIRNWLTATGADKPRLVKGERDTGGESAASSNVERYYYIQLASQQGEPLIPAIKIRADEITGQPSTTGDGLLTLNPNPPMGGVKAGQIGMREPTREKAWAPLGPM